MGILPVCEAPSHRSLKLWGQFDCKGTFFFNLLSCVYSEFHSLMFSLLLPSFLFLSAIPHSVSSIKFLPQQIYYWYIGKVLGFVSRCFAEFVYRLQEPLGVSRVFQVHKQGSLASFFLMYIHVIFLVQRVWLKFQVPHLMKVTRLGIRFPWN